MPVPSMNDKETIVDECGTSSLAAKESLLQALAHSTPLQPTHTMDDLPDLKERARLAFNRNDFLTASKIYTQMIAVKPALEYYRNRCLCYGHLSRYTDALADANHVISLSPTARNYYRRGALYERIHDLYHAQQDIQHGLSLDPKSQDLLGAEKVISAQMKAISELVQLKPGQETHHPDEAQFIALVSWLHAGGAKFPKLRLEYYGEDHRGVCARQDITPNELVLFIPHRYIMTSEVARASRIGGQLLATGVELRSKHSFLSAYLLEEKERGESSFWWPYLSILPKSFNTTPLFFNEQDLARLKGSCVLLKTADRLSSLCIEYHNICTAIPSFARFSYEQFQWARVAVITRIFGILVEGQKTDGLVPMADLLNHQLPRQTKWNYDSPTRGFVITSLTTIMKGLQVFDSYGRKCNSRFLVNYGFALENNEDNETVIRVQFPEITTVLQMQMKGGLKGGLKGDSPSPSPYPYPSYQPDPVEKPTTTSLYNLIQQGHGETLELLNEMAIVKLKALQKFSHSNSVSDVSYLHAEGGVEKAFDNLSKGYQANMFSNSSTSTSTENLVSDNDQDSDQDVNNAQDKEEGLVESLAGLLSISCQREYQVPANVSEKKTTDMFSFLRLCVADIDELESLVAAVSVSNTTKHNENSPPSPIQISEAAAKSVVHVSSHSSHDSSAGKNSMSPLERWRNLSGHPNLLQILSAMESPVSIRNEREAMKLLEAACVERLREFPTTLEQDVIDLSSYYPTPRDEKSQKVSFATKSEMSDVSFIDAHTFHITPFTNERNSLIMVKGEKEVLCWFLTLARQVIAVIDVKCVEQGLKNYRTKHPIWNPSTPFGSVVSILEAKNKATWETFTPTLVESASYPFTVGPQVAVTGHETYLYQTIAPLWDFSASLSHARRR